MVIVQDIHLSDKALWQNFQELWANKDYGAAISLLTNEQLASRGLTAELLNALTDYIVEVEGTKDDTFKQDKIKVSETPPTGIQSGEVYFQLT